MIPAMNETHEALVEFLELRRDPAKNLHALKKVFDEMPREISDRIQRAGQLSIAPGWNDCLHAAGECEPGCRLCGSALHQLLL
jgi:hypothetical protein